jgi:tetratricopeptide (TPR) repeat protein
MAQRKSVRGPRSSLLWLAIILILVLAIALAAVVFVVGPERQLAVQATATAQAYISQATATAQAHTSEVQRAYDAGIAFATASNWGRAAEEFAKVVALEPGYKDITARLAEARENADAARATATAQAAATVTAEIRSAIESAYQRGLAYFDLERWEQANAEFEQVIAVDPDYKDVQAKLAEVEVRLAEVRALTPTATSLPLETPTPEPTATPNTNVIYSNDFEGAVQSEWGSEWSNASTDITPNGQTFLGQFGDDTVSLTLGDLPSHTDVTVSFDLFIIRSWDGSGRGGPDVWDLSMAGGPTLLHTTFANYYDERQAYPGAYPGEEHPPGTGAAETNTLGFTYSGNPSDSVYHLSFTLPHSMPSLVLEFSASGLEDLSNESWGLDNVEVRVTSGSP